MRPTPCVRQAGFTLVELLIAFAVALLVLAGASAAFRAGASVLEFGLDQAGAQATARWAVERMIQEIRAAGADPTAGATYNFDAIASPTGTSLILQSDLNGNGVLDPPVGTCDPTAVAERVRYELVGTELRRSTNPTDPACDAAVATGVLGLAFQYFDAAGSTTADPSLIRAVGVTVQVASENGATERAVVLRDQVRLRNR